MSIQCPDCKSENLKPAGSDKGEQRVQCLDCGRKTVRPIIIDEDASNMHVKLAKKAQKYQDINRIERKTFRNVAQLSNALEELDKKLIDLLEKKSLSKFVVSHKAKKDCGVGIIQISDAHFNELVNMKSNKYDFIIASKRLQKLAHKAKKYFSNIGVKNIVLALTGDLLNSDRRLDEKLNMATNRTNAMFLAVDILQCFLLDLNKDFNIAVASVSGNESRVGEEWGWSNMIVEDNYDYAIFKILKLLFKNSKGIEFIDGNGVEQVININGRNILITHGINIPTNNLEKEVQKIKGRYADDEDTILHYIIFGHTHSARIGDTYARSSSLSGGNEYSSRGLNLSGKASQNIFFVSCSGELDGLKVDLQNYEDFEGYITQDLGDCYNTKSKKKLKEKIFSLKS